MLLGDSALVFSPIDRTERTKFDDALAFYREINYGGDQHDHQAKKRTKHRIYAIDAL
jgi:hypothetical protein